MEVAVFKKGMQSLIKWRFERHAQEVPGRAEFGYDRDFAETALAIDVLGKRDHPGVVQFPDNIMDTKLQSVLQVPMVDFEKTILALLAWREMRHDMFIGMTAAAQVVANRARAGWFEGNIYKNCVAKNVYPRMTAFGHPDTIRYPNAEDRQFVLFLNMLDAIVEGTAKDNTAGALYYDQHAEGLELPTRAPWFVLNGQHTTCATIGKTIFWKEVAEKVPGVVN